MNIRAGLVFLAALAIGVLVALWLVWVAEDGIDLARAFLTMVGIWIVGAIVGTMLSLSSTRETLSQTALEHAARLERRRRDRLNGSS